MQIYLVQRGRTSLEPPDWRRERFIKFSSDRWSYAGTRHFFMSIVHWLQRCDSKRRKQALKLAVLWNVRWKLEWHTHAHIGLFAYYF